MDDAEYRRKGVCGGIVTGVIKSLMNSKGELVLAHHGFNEGMFLLV